jgi:hypothetical protein
VQREQVVASGKIDREHRLSLSGAAYIIVSSSFRRDLFVLVCITTTTTTVTEVFFTLSRKIGSGEGINPGKNGNEYYPSENAADAVAIAAAATAVAGHL